MKWHPFKFRKRNRWKGGRNTNREYVWYPF